MKVKLKSTVNEVIFFKNFIVEKEALGLSKKSIENYKKVYSKFTKDIGEKISKESISKWIQMMMSSDMNSISVNFYIVQIRVFAYWLMNNGYCERFVIKKIIYCCNLF